MITEELEKKMELYEQLYFAMDEPVPFKKGLKCYPVPVSKYYDFYSCYSCLTLDKTVKKVPDKLTGKLIEIPNPQGIAQSYLDYLISQMKDPMVGPQITQQLISLLSMVMHITPGVFCQKCKHEISYEDFFKDYDSIIKENISKIKNEMLEKAKEESEQAVQFIQNLPPQVEEAIQRKAVSDFYEEHMKCPECGEEMRDIFTIKENKETNLGSLLIRDVSVNQSDFDFLVALIPRQNIINYDDDKYVDPELKKELEIKAKLSNNDYTQPSLEKQLLCVSIGTGFTTEYLKTIPIRKLSYYLKLIDKKEQYYTMLGASMSGFVEFKKPPEHWIFSDDKPNLAKELSDAGSFEDKIRGKH